MERALEVTDLRKEYNTRGATVPALRGVSLTVEDGEFVAVMGASGSGKSTLLHLIGGLDSPTAGSIVIEGHDLAAMTDRQRTLFRRRRLGIIFQAYNLLPTLTAAENITLPAVIDGASTNDREFDRRARELLDLVDLNHCSNRRPQTLSGGEQQRVAIARALMNDPALILADEPTGNLDSQHAEVVWRLLRDLARRQERSIVAVTHEPSGATFADRIIILKDGKNIAEIKPGGEGHASFVATRYAELVG